MYYWKLHCGHFPFTNNFPIADELTDFKNQVETLEDENEELKKMLQNKDSNVNVQKQQQSCEELAWQSNVFALEAEMQNLRKTSVLNSEELRKAKDELKAKELDLFHVDFEKTKQLDTAKYRIQDLEKDVANYVRRNNDLKAEIRNLRNREEPTIDVGREMSARLVVTTCMNTGWGE